MCWTAEALSTSWPRTTLNTPVELDRVSSGVYRVHSSDGRVTLTLRSRRRRPRRDGEGENA
jgi:hypothetical protein